MKALQGKKPEPRALRTKALAALCAIALAFAFGACSTGADDGGGDDGGRVSGSGGSGSGKWPVSMVASGYSGAIYQGLPLEMPNISATITYNDGSTAVVRDPSKFETEPHYGTGWYDTETMSFVPLRDYTLTYTENDRQITQQIRLTTIGFSRSNSWMEELPFPYERNGQVGVNFWLGDGIHATGIDTMRKRYYVDEIPNFSGITIEANYEDGTKQVIPLQEVPEDRHVRWQIRPRYDNGQGEGSGDLLLTIGINPEVAPGLLGTRGDPGMTVTLPLDRVWHVVGLKWVQEPVPANSPLYYWEADTYTYWYNKATVSTAKMEITYSDRSTQIKSVAAMHRENAIYQVWHNANPNARPDENGVDTPSYLTDNRQVINRMPFWIEGVLGTNAILEGNTDSTTMITISNANKSKVMFYYRGWRLYQDWPVYTRLESIEARANGASPIPVDLTPRDNDYLYDRNASWFGGQISVTAVFSSRQTTVPARLPLSYDSGTFDDDSARAGAPSIGPGNLRATNYSTNFGRPNSYNPLTKRYNPDGWGQSSIPRNNNREGTLVRVAYQSPNYVRTLTLDGFLSYAITGNRTQSADVPVAWTNIGNPQQ